jgi:hypothetical protein
MQLTIIADDGVVIVNGKPLPVDLSQLDASIHAVQWTGATGWVEFKPDENGDRQLNAKFTDLAPYQQFVDAWDYRLQNPPAPEAP